jgi:hypothetical protein
LNAFYGATVERIPLPVWQPDTSYEQWVSLETQSGRLIHDNDPDPAYHFHRCLRFLNIFLQSHVLAFRDPRVREVTTPELKPIVFVGQIEPNGDWSLQTPMITHLEAMSDFSEHAVESGSSHLSQLAYGLSGIVEENPLVTTTLLTIRAHGAHWMEGNYLDAVVALETAMESRLYALWRSILVDIGKSSTEIETTVNQDSPYKSLLIKQLPSLVGGRWDTTASGTPVGDYWAGLYMLRNRIVHTGYTPTAGQVNRAREVHDAFRAFVRERVWQRRKDYPRTVLLFVPAEVMDDRGWGQDARFAKVSRALQDEERPFFLPWDLAGRPKPTLK